MFIVRLTKKGKKVAADVYRKLAMLETRAQSLRKRRKIPSESRRPPATPVTNAGVPRPHRTALLTAMTASSTATAPRALFRREETIFPAH
jgi:hypothetical protein